MSSLRWAECLIIFQLAVLTYPLFILRKNGIPQTKDSCVGKNDRIQFLEFLPENSAEEYELYYEYEDDLILELSFCTRSKVAIIAEIQNITAKQSLFIQILDGLLQLSIEEHGKWNPECHWFLSDKPVNDGTLHTVKIKTSLTQSLLGAQHYHMYKLAGNERSVSYSSCVSNGTLSKLHHLVLGGEIIAREPNHKVEVLYNFAGCLRNIRLNGRPIENASEKLTSEDVTPGCQEYDESCKEVCPPTSKYSNGFCLCPEGTQMDVDDVCSPTCSCIDCKNGGTCISSSMGPYCVCRTGYSGSSCEAKLDPCTDISCNNGSCMRDEETSSFWCVCDPGFKGLLCEKKDVCFSNPCLNGGTCYENPGRNFCCACPLLFKGHDCGIELDIQNRTKVLSIALGSTFSAVGLVLLVCLFWHCWPNWRDRNRAPSSTTEEEQTDSTGGTLRAVVVNGSNGRNKNESKKPTKLKRRKDKNNNARVKGSDYIKSSFNKEKVEGSSDKATEGSPCDNEVQRNSESVNNLASESEEIFI